MPPRAVHMSTVTRLRNGTDRPGLDDVMVVTVLLFTIAALNGLPGVVAFWPERARTLYGFGLEGAALELAMRHRAVLLASVGVLLGMAALDRSWLLPALTLAGLSKVAFLVLYVRTGPHQAPMRRVAVADVLALVGLACVAVLHDWT